MPSWKKLFSSAEASTEQSPPIGSAPTVPDPKVHPQGLDVISEGSNPIIDIVFIHGLNGHREKTWIADNGVHWLRDYLSIDISEARIISWGYDANTHAASQTCFTFLYDHARTLVSDLNRRRELTNSSERPIIFIAHSLGGIVLKSALIHSDAARKGALLNHRSIKLSTYGIIFMGTPHQGGNGVQLGRILVNTASVFMPADDRLLRHLERDSEWLLQQLGQYGPISGDFVTKFAYEEYETPIALGKKIMVVPRASAVVPGQADAEPIAIHANHKNMVKFTSKQDSGYTAILETLQIMMKHTVVVIRARWEAERRVENVRDNATDFSLVFSLSDVNYVDQFVSRNEELVQLQQILTTSRERRTVIIHALGGMGKTQLAVAFAKQNHTSFSAVFWMNATDNETLKRSFIRAADRILRERSPIAYIENAVSSDNTDEIVKAVGRWLSEHGNNRWLIIFDNYDHPSLGGNIDRQHSRHDDSIVSKEYDIRPFFPDTHHGAIIITTRSATVKLGKTMQLSKFKRIEDSLEILESTSNRLQLTKDPAAVVLAQKLDGLPLALATAGAYLDQVAISCAEYLELYKDSWGRLQESSPKLLSYEYRAMYSTWNISYKNVETQNEPAAMLLKLWAYFDHDDLWYGLLCGAKGQAPPWLDALTDKLTFMKSIRLLCDHGLVEGNAVVEENEAGSSGYSVHGCVHAWMINVLHTTTDTDMAQLAATCVASLLPGKNDNEYWHLHRRLLQHVDRCSEIAAGSTEMPDFKPWIYNSFGCFYIEQDRLEVAEVMLKQAMKQLERTLGPEYISTLDTAHNLAVTHAYQGRFSKAEAIYERALQGYEKVLGPNHPKSLDTVNNLGSVYVDQYRLEEAEQMYERALEGYQVAFGHDDRSTLDAMNNVGLLYVRQGQLDKAEEIFKRALKGREATLVPNHISTLDTVTNLGAVYAAQGRLDEAEILCERALQGKENALGPKHTITLDTVKVLAVIYEYQGRLDEAEAMYKRALEGYETATTFKTYLRALKTLENFGDLYQRMNKPELSEQVYLQAYDGYVAVFGDDSEQARRVQDELKNLRSCQPKSQGCIVI